MENLDEVYAALARGDGEVPRDRKVIDALLDRVFEARRSDRVSDRLAALRVAQALGERAGLDLVETFMQDPAIEVRRYAFNLGLAARADGLRIIREAAADPAPELALEALRLLTVAADRGSTTRARTLLDATNPAVRASAVRLLGHVAGPAVKRELEALGEDEDLGVRQAVHEAIRRIEGELPRNTAGQWWDEPPDDGDALLGPDGFPPADTLRPRDGPASLSPEDTLDPDKVAAAKDPNESTWGPEVDSDEPLWPEDAQLPATPDGEWTGEYAALPATLPTEAYALLRLLGVVSPNDRPIVVDALRKADMRALNENVQGHRPGRNPARARGIAFAAMALGKTSWLAKVRRLLGDPEPLVRAAAAEAVGALGGPSTLTQISGLLVDEDARVRAAAVRVLGDACARWNLLTILPRWLEQVAEDDSPAVQKARAMVLDRVAAAAEPGDSGEDDNGA